MARAAHGQSECLQSNRLAGHFDEGSGAGVGGLQDSCAIVINGDRDAGEAFDPANAMVIAVRDIDVSQAVHGDAIVALVRFAGQGTRALIGIARPRVAGFCAHPQEPVVFAKALAQR